MRDRQWLDFVRDRVLAEIAANPSVRPYLGEEEPKQKPGPKPERDDAIRAERRRRRLEYQRRWFARKAAGQ